MAPVPPPNYLCRRCHIPGHYIHDCSRRPESRRSPESNRSHSRHLDRKKIQYSGLKPPPGYVCYSCRVADDHYFNDCPKKAIQEKEKKLSVTMYAHALSVMSRIYVGGIDFAVNEETVKSTFSPFGPIKSLSMTIDPTHGRHKGFAFLEYDVPEAANLAIEQMNGIRIGSKPVKVGRPSNMPQAMPVIETIQAEALQHNRIYVASVPRELSVDDVRKVFDAFGKITNCELARSPEDISKHRGFGYILYAELESAIKAVTAMNLFELGGQHLRVHRAISPPEAQSYVAAAVAAAQVAEKIFALESADKTKIVVKRDDIRVGGSSINAKKADIHRATNERRSYNRRTRSRSRSWSVSKAERSKHITSSKRPERGSRSRSRSRDRDVRDSRLRSQHSSRRDSASPSMSQPRFPSYWDEVPNDPCASSTTASASSALCPSSHLLFPAAASTLASVATLDVERGGMRNVVVRVGVPAPEKNNPKTEDLSSEYRSLLEKLELHLPSSSSTSFDGVPPVQPASHIARGIPDTARLPPAVVKDSGARLSEEMLLTMLLEQQRKQQEQQQLLLKLLCEQLQTPPSSSTSQSKIEQAPPTVNFNQSQAAKAPLETPPPTRHFGEFGEKDGDLVLDAAANVFRQQSGAWARPSEAQKSQRTRAPDPQLAKQHPWSPLNTAKPMSTQTSSTQPWSGIVGFDNPRSEFSVDFGLSTSASTSGTLPRNLGETKNLCEAQQRLDPNKLCFKAKELLELLDKQQSSSRF